MQLHKVQNKQEYFKVNSPLPEYLPDVYTSVNIQINKPHSKRAKVTLQGEICDKNTYHNAPRLQRFH